MVINDTNRGGGNENDQNNDSNDFGDLPCEKACTHDETTMSFLRPFAALEVINSRVCSQSNGLVPVYKLYQNELLLSSLTTKQHSYTMIALRQ